VLPWVGFLLNTWLGIVIGIIVYIGSMMSKIFGAVWDDYCRKVLISWL